ncbi:hypothetical protein BJX70DRAFT_78510 [Aspergillus crustosus]
MQGSQHDGVRHRRMRLGTRSCAECRRRKVRCIYPPHSSCCQQCEAHGTSCHQQSPRSTATVAQKSHDGSLTEDLNERIRQLERLVGQMCNASPGSLQQPRQMGQADALKYLCPSYSLTSNAYPSPVSEDDDDPAQGSLQDSPLVDLMRRALSIEDAVRHSACDSISTDRCGPTIRALRALKLAPEYMSLVLQMTEKYWPLWPIVPPGFVPEAPSDPLGIQAATTFINHSIQSENPEVVAKDVLWLALCIQQLPSDFDSLHHRLPCPRRVLFDAYLNGAETLLQGPYDGLNNFTFLECLMLLAKLYINMGKPRKAWLAVRRAINSVLLQGPQSAQRPDAERLQAIWLQIWSFDRQLSMFMGLPHSVPDSYPGPIPIPDDDFSARFQQAIGVVAGIIGERNLNLETADYSSMSGIEHELFKLREMMPIEWDLPNTPDLSLGQVYTKQIGKFYYHFLLKNAHFPYMLRRPQTEDPYLHSREIAVGASRKMIEHYHGLRHSAQGEVLICDLMDFQVFSAAIVLAINLLCPDTPTNTSQDQNDWALIQELSTTLGALAKAMTCSIAKQASQLLDYLHAAGHGLYTHDTPFEAVIPYFGKVRISHLREKGYESGSSATDQHTPPFNMVEFSTQTASPQGVNKFGYHLGESELGTDWNVLGEAEVQWDWNQLFTMPK